MTICKVLLTDSSVTTRFAYDEFVRLMKKLDPSARISLAKEGEEYDLTVGVSNSCDLPTVEDATLDDAYAIDVKALSGHIAASNARSVLFAVYRFFKEAGASFCRPGRDGERVPKKCAACLNVKVQEKAAYRYRGVCIEGSAGYEHVVDMIDFCPKLGLNIFFTQLWKPTFMLDRWYGNERNPSYTPAKLSEEAQECLVREYDRQVEKRGLNNHKMGHGWISSVIGEKSGVWHGISREGLLTEDKRHLVAEIGGKRDLFAGSAVDTSLCYGNPEARKLFNREVVKYAVEHPEIDTLHVWLADQPNNQCECELCRDTLPTDFYVEMLNALDEELTAAGCTTRIVFLSYLELFWTPKMAKIKNPERFMLLFAPIRRPYERPLSAQREGALAPFKRNAWVNPCTSFSSLLYLDEWKKLFPGECVLFDYHLMWDMYNDISSEAVGGMLGVDMAELKANGLDGMISCQGVRLGIYGALPMCLMANALWSGKSDTDAEIEAYYRSCYGEDAPAVREVMTLVRRTLDPNMLRGVAPVPADEAELCIALKEAIKSFAPTLQKHSCDEDFSLRVSFINLGATLRLSDSLADFILAALKKDSDGALALWDKTLTVVRETEALYPRALDAFEFSLVWHRHVLPVFFPDWKIDYDSGELTM